MTTPGHNTDPAGRVKEFTQRFVKLFEDVAEMQSEVRDLATEAKNADLNPKLLKRLAKQQMEDAVKRAKRQQDEETFDRYCHAIGLLD